MCRQLIQVTHNFLDAEITIFNYILGYISEIKKEYFLLWRHLINKSRLAYSWQ